jgi:hypothetical protein
MWAHISFKVSVADLVSIIRLFRLGTLLLCFPVGGGAGGLCWIQDNFQLMTVALIPVWLSLRPIVYCNVSIIYNFMKTTRGGLVVTLTPRTKIMMYRLAAIPIFAVMVWLPATILRVADVYSVRFQNQSVLDYLWVCTFGSSGVFNCIIYIFMDSTVVEAWKQVFRNLNTRSHQNKDSKASSTFSGPASTYGHTPSFMTSTASSTERPKTSGAYGSNNSSSRDTESGISISMIDIVYPAPSRNTFNLDRHVVRASEFSVDSMANNDSLGSDGRLTINTAANGIPNGLPGDSASGRVGRQKSAKYNKTDRISNFGISGANLRDSQAGSRFSWAARPANDMRDITTFTTVRESLPPPLMGANLAATSVSSPVASGTSSPAESMQARTTSNSGFHHALSSWFGLLLAAGGSKTETTTEKNGSSSATAAAGAGAGAGGGGSSSGHSHEKISSTINISNPILCSTTNPTATTTTAGRRQPNNSGVLSEQTEF